MENKNEAEIIEMLEAAAEQMIREGCMNTTEGNMIFGTDDLSKYLPALDIEEYQGTLCDILCGREEVAAVDVVNGQFDVAYHLDFCPNYWGALEEEPEPQQGREKPSILAQLEAHKKATQQGTSPLENTLNMDMEKELQ